MVDRERFSAAIFRRGQKMELFDGGEELGEDAELQMKLDELLEIWKIPRTGKDLAAAIWRPQHQAAEVVLQKGRLFSHMGFMWRKKLHLHIEEAVYLIDRANLLLFVENPGSGKRLLSLQEAQELMLASGVTMNMFLVYCKLMRAGFITLRHPASWIVKASESPPEVWKRPNSYYNSIENRTTLQIEAQTEDKIEEPPAPKRRRIEGQEQADGVAANGTAKSDNINDNNQGEVGNKWWVKSDSCSWAQFEQTALPRCLVVESTTERTLSLKFPNMQALHHIQPEEVVDVATINQDGASMLHFDVYHANSQFSRKTPGDPMVVVCVCEGNSPPTMAACNAADEAAGGIPVRYARVEYADIAFFALARTELPSILR